jgi:amidase
MAEQDTTDTSQHAFTAHVNSQATKQLAPPAYTGKRALDIAPFAMALLQLSDRRAAQIEHLLDQADVPAIQSLLEKRLLSSVELVTWLVRRIHRQDADRLNSIIELNPDALLIAADLDRERTSGSTRGPLHGIPVLFKDNIATGDRMHNTAGALALANALADRPAFIAQKLRDAGTILLGKTNLTEWANFMTSTSANGFSALGGQTRNPHGPFDVGGSSAGSAVAVAAGFAPLSVGTETAGSIVYPASQNEVVGLKPSLGLVSRDRIIPISPAMDTAGPMARSVGDLAILFSALVGEDPNDPLTAAARPLAGMEFTTCLDAAALAGARVVLALPAVEHRPEDELIFAKVADVLTQAGATVVRVEMERPTLDYLPVFFHDLVRGVDGYLGAIGDAAPIGSLAEIVAFNEEDAMNRAPYGQDLLAQSVAFEMSDDEYGALVTQNREMAASILRQMMADHHADLLATLSNYLTLLYAPAGFPAITVPAGRRSSGEPVGVTFVGDYLSDCRLIAAGYAFERANAQHRPAVD